MQSFPDEAQMPRSANGEEPIRGGSIGLNRILGFFVAASSDPVPRFNAVLVSAFTVFRNVFTMLKEPNMNELEEGFVKDVNLLLEYYDAYISHTRGRGFDGKFFPVIVYFPDYSHLPQDIMKDMSGEKRGPMLFRLYHEFIARHGQHNEQVRQLENVRCYWISAGHATYPHKEVADKFRTIAGKRDSAYAGGEPICLITNTPLDLYIHLRLRNLVVLESYTGTIRKPSEFHLKLDKDGRVPFYPAVHIALGDEPFVKSLATLKQRREIFKQAEADKWITRSETDVIQRLSRICEIPANTFRQYDFI